MTGRRLNFAPGDGFGEAERAALIAFIAANPPMSVAPLRWRCAPHLSDPHEIRDTGTHYAVSRLPFIGHPVHVAAWCHIGHRDEAWARAVGSIMAVAQTAAGVGGMSGRRNRAAVAAKMRGDAR